MGDGSIGGQGADWFLVFESGTESQGSWMSRKLQPGIRKGELLATDHMHMLLQQEVRHKQGHTPAAEGQVQELTTTDRAELLTAHDEL